MRRQNHFGSSCKSSVVCKVAIDKGSFTPWLASKGLSKSGQSRWLEPVVQLNQDAP